MQTAAIRIPDQSHVIAEFRSHNISGNNLGCTENLGIFSVLENSGAVGWKAGRQDSYFTPNGRLNRQKGEH
jgi:hypothetical protein